MIIEESSTVTGIKVTVIYPEPEKIPEYILREKINALYELLKPQTSQEKQ